MVLLHSKTVCAEETNTNSVDPLSTINQNFFQKNEEINFYMFASFGLSDNILRQMIDYAKTYNGTIVLRGLENNSFKSTAEHIQKLVNEDEEAAIIIDPILFTKFEIKQVPAYVIVKQEACATQMSCSNSYDKISGNITPKFALEKFIEKGELSNKAAKILETSR